MSRTFRKRINYYTDVNREINSLERVFNIIQDYGVEELFSDRILETSLFQLCQWYQHIIYKIFIDKTLTIENKNSAILDKLNQYIVSEKRQVACIKGDFGNWRGTALKLTKEYSNIKSRAGKRVTVNIIKNKVNLNDLDALNDVLYFEEPNLGKIKAINVYILSCKLMDRTFFIF